MPAHVPAERIFDFDVFNDPALSHDLHLRIAEVRGQAPNVCYTPRNGGHWLVFGREELQRVLSGDTAFSSRQLSLQPSSAGQKMIPLSLDPPEHAPYRHLLLKYLGPKEARQLEPFIRGWAERLIQKLDGRTSCEFIKDVAEPMPISVFMELMGLPLERFDEFRGLASGALNPNTDPAKRPELHMRIIGVITEIIQARTAEPRDDLVSHLLAETLDGRPLTLEEMFSICFLLFLAGLDTVTNAMGYGMRHLAADPALQAKLRANPAAIPATVEELLRRYTFVNTVRVATRDVELDGVTIKEGEALSCVLWGGSNDKGVEGDVRQMAFGSGPHTCLGMHLARTELRIMYETWFAHVGVFTLPENDDAVMHGGSVMGIERLPLLLQPRKLAA
jgi:cytochrome P450